MRCGSQVKGQAMVESAIILPLLFFVMWSCFGLFKLCHNAIALQSAAAHIVRQEALQDVRVQSRRLASFSVPHRLLGKMTPMRRHSYAQAVQPWRPFRGFSAVRTRGSIINMEIDASLLPQSFLDWRLPLTGLSYTARFPTEPPIPGEK